MLLLVVWLVGCDPAPGHADERDAADACRNHPLVRALPSATHIAGLPRQSPECTWDHVQLVYGGGSESARSCSIGIFDFQAALPPELDQPEAIELVRSTMASTRDTYRSGIQLQTDHRDFMLGGGRFLEMIGGEQHLPVVDTLPSGDPYVIPVPTIQDGPWEESLIGLLRDRYGLSIGCTEKITDQASAKALYAPWIRALDIGALP